MAAINTLKVNNTEYDIRNKKLGIAHFAETQNKTGYIVIRIAPKSN